MSTTAKSPKRVLAVAHWVGGSALCDYAHKFSPKKFTQPQLFACLVLKEFLQLDYAVSDRSIKRVTSSVIGRKRRPGRRLHNQISSEKQIMGDLNGLTIVVLISVYLYKDGKSAGNRQS